ncbi:hypothetical protein OAM37_00590 [bacterium]|nr:hypothetical protein [bacterium]
MNQCNQLYTTPTYSNTNSQAAAPKTVASNGEPRNTFEVLSDSRIRERGKRDRTLKATSRWNVPLIFRFYK